MRRRLLRFLLLLLLLAAGGLFAMARVPVSLALGPCLKDWTNLNSYQRRPSPLSSTTMALGTGRVKICYGRPSSRGRVVFGELVPYGQYWRLGANEPTRLSTDVALDFGGLQVPPGRYSLYALVQPDQWIIVVNRSVTHWGTDFSDRVLSQELGRITVPATRLQTPVETLTLRLESPNGRKGRLVIWWERTTAEVVIRVRSEE
jgi:hypothetical protein